ncbi:uncharacterized protein LOC120322392 [Drosophila yakuba]|uniref:uncharacterized protein LOC120322392 n=1 Tax=Drosophila yakuba TaxID=7245 RepID=UPI00193076D4|nr:uncharacterized protein LOC120322392 [Drosophila yakuba]
MELLGHAMKPLNAPGLPALDTGTLEALLQGSRMKCPYMLRAAAPGPQAPWRPPLPSPRLRQPRVDLPARVPGPASDCWPACLLAAEDDSHLFFYCEQQSALTLP